MYKYTIIIILIIASATYYFIPYEASDYSQIFLTISTFLFAIFAGFFIFSARQTL